MTPQEQPDSQDRADELANLIKSELPMDSQAGDSPAEALRQLNDKDLPEAVAMIIHKDPLHAVDNLVRFIEKYVTAYAATVEREAASRELKQLVADTLTPENVGGHFIHDEVKEFAKQQREFIDARLAALQGPPDGSDGLSEPAKS